MCDSFHGVCLNLAGSFSCSCATGFQLQTNISTKCSDVNECINGVDCGFGSCINTEGSYYCECGSGYRYSEVGTCQDVDECQTTPSPCSYNCTNTNGSFICHCPGDNGGRSLGHDCDKDVNKGAQGIIESLSLNPNRILKSKQSTSEIIGFVCAFVIALTTILLISSFVFRHCRRQLSDLKQGKNRSLNIYMVKNSCKQDRKSYGYHLAIPAIDEDQ